MTSSTETTGFDTAGRPTTQTVTVHVADGAITEAAVLDDAFTFTTSYFRNGAVRTQTYPAVNGTTTLPAETVTIGYSTLGMPSTQVSNQFNTFIYIGKTLFDDLGRPILSVLGAVDPNSPNPNLPEPLSDRGEQTRAGYSDVDGRLDWQHAVTGAGQVMQDDDYAYDAVGNPTRITHRWMTGVPGFTDAETECFEYDARQRLTQAYTVNDEQANNCTGGAPGTESGPTPYNISYAIDVIGNITSFEGRTRSHGAAAPTSGCNEDTNTTKPHAVATTAATTGGTTTMAYNCNGAITHTGNTGSQPYDEYTYEWDQLQRLHKIHLDWFNTTTNYYDTTNNRVLRVDPDGTRTVYLGNTEIRYTPANGPNPATVRAARSYGQTRRDFTGEIVRFATNHQGSVTATISNAAGGVPQRIRYTPYGTTRTSPNNEFTTNLDDRNFLNQPDDPNRDTIYLNNRHYLPNIGVFASVDPLAVQTRDPYVYAAANPMTLSDPSGLEPCHYAQERGQRNACRDEYRDQSRLKGKLELGVEQLSELEEIGYDDVEEEFDVWFTTCGLRPDLCRDMVLRHEEYGLDDPVQVGTYIAVVAAFMAWQEMRWDDIVGLLPWDESYGDLVLLSNPDYEHALANLEIDDLGISFDLGWRAPGGGLTFGFSVSGCFFVCVQAGFYGMHPFGTLGGAGMGASANVHVITGGACGQDGWAVGGSYVSGFGGGYSMSMNLADDFTHWEFHPENSNLSGSVGARIQGSVPVAGGQSHTWVLGC